MIIIIITYMANHRYHPNEYFVLCSISINTFQRIVCLHFRHSLQSASWTPMAFQVYWIKHVVDVIVYWFFHYWICLSINTIEEWKEEYRRHMQSYANYGNFEEYQEKSRKWQYTCGHILFDVFRIRRNKPYEPKKKTISTHEHRDTEYPSKLHYCVYCDRNTFSLNIGRIP